MSTPKHPLSGINSPKQPPNDRIVTERDCSDEDEKAAEDYAHSVDGNFSRMERSIAADAFLAGRLSLRAEIEKIKDSAMNVMLDAAVAHSRIDQAVREAVAEERERCAGILRAEWPYIPLMDYDAVLAKMLYPKSETHPVNEVNPAAKAFEAAHKRVMEKHAEAFEQLAKKETGE